MAEARYLTFNWHETYLHMLASTGGQWDFVPRVKGGREDWFSEIRPLPPNARLISEADALDLASRGTYQAAVCHNLLDLGLVIDTGVPTVTIFHTSKDLELAYGLNADAFAVHGGPLLARSRVVFVSQMKQQSWGINGEVILPGVDIEAYGGWTGEQLRVLHVGNLKRELAAVNGMADLEAAVAGLPFTLVGLNPSIAGAQLSRNWDDLRATLRAHRAYVHTTRAPFEDGYNLAMLEAMATGLPIVTLAHPSSPIVDGHNGRVGQSAQALRLSLLELLEDSGQAAAFGTAARETVARQFPMDRFRAAWRALIG
jgi:hypothetical protein